MLFNSVSFLLFFPLTMAAYFALPFRARWAFLLAASAAFYMAFVPAYLLVLLGVIAVDYVAGLWIERTAGPARRAVLAVSVVANVGVLAAFKYVAFLNENVAAAADRLHLSYPAADVLAWYAGHVRALAGLLGGGGSYADRPLALLLPLGLSFHTFQAMSYTIEVYRGRQRAERHPGVYALYVLFYPQLVAGPIERPQHLLHQLRRPVRFDPDRAADGLRRMLWGFFKKLVIADRAAPIVDAVYAQPSRHGGRYVLVATYVFAVQIYCDFSGYTDICLGAARVLGVRLRENFDRPYAARSVAEFWRRWHTSLSTWFRDYVYIPLGGGRAGPWRWGAAVLAVFVVSGLWHGASWTFAVWGLLHATYLIVGRLTARPRAAIAGRLGLGRGSPVGDAVRVVVTFHLVAFAWVFFRATSLADAWAVVARVAGSAVGRAPWSGPRPYSTADLTIVVALSVVLAAVEWAGRRPRVVQWLAGRPRWALWPADYAQVLAILALGNLGARSFVYFQF